MVPKALSFIQQIQFSFGKCKNDLAVCMYFLWVSLSIFLSVFVTFSTYSQFKNENCLILHWKQNIAVHETSINFSNWFFGDKHDFFEFEMFGQQYIV